MMYTGKYFTIENSRVFGENVNVLEYRSEKGEPQGTCSLCGKPLKRHWWTVQTAEENLEICNVGNDCVKKLS